MDLQQRVIYRKQSLGLTFTETKNNGAITIEAEGALNEPYNKPL